jgi:hypothetical protein
MDEISINSNCVTTECGHKFHASCLMENVAHNGFCCPYCRTVMAEKVEDEDEEEDEEDEELYNDFALRGLRFFTNNLDGLQHDENDEEEEKEEEEFEDIEEEEIVKPSFTFITQKLVEKGVTMEQLVKSLLTNHDEYCEDNELIRVDNELWGKFRIIINNYQREARRSPSTSTSTSPRRSPSPRSFV